ncbi:hypothetical protein CR513_20081, partial [Mucuna pruriens]
MKSRESVRDYFSRTMAIVNKMQIHGDKTEGITVVEKIIWSMTPKFNFVVCSIEEAHDIEELSIDELQKEKEDEEQEEVKASEAEAEEAMIMAINKNIGNTMRINSTEEVEVEEAITLQLTDQSQQTSQMLSATDSKCRTSLNKDNGDKTNFIEKEEEVSLLMVCHVKKETQQNIWYLDTSCSNHMCGNKMMFSDLDETFSNVVKFGDNSTISVLGKGTVTLQTKENSTHTISNVLFVPDLKTNLLSVGQLQEKGYKISIKDGVCQIRDAKLGLIARIKMLVNRMFPLYLHNTNHSCFSTKLKDDAWLWHFFYGHLNFNGLKTLWQKNMVTRLPQITAPSEVCEECMISKQHQN